MATLPAFSAKVLNSIHTYFLRNGYEEGYSDLTATDIAKTLNVEPKAVNAALARLNADALVELEEWDGNSKIQNFVHITKKGTDVAQERAAEAGVEPEAYPEADKKRAKQDAKNARARRRRAARKAAAAVPQAE